MDEESHEDREAQGGVDVICGVGDESFGEFVEGDGNGSLETDGHERVFSDMVVV